MDQEKILMPDHYHKKDIDPIGYLEQHFPDHPTVTVAEGFYIGNVIKYVSRYKDKNGLADLIKARNYLNMLIESEKNKKEESLVIQEVQKMLLSGELTVDQIKERLCK